MVANKEWKAQLRKTDSRIKKELIRKQEILDGAADCFMRRGFHATTIDQIADRVGATKGLLYYHFPSKADLFFAVYRATMERAIGRSEAILELEHKGAEKLRQLCNAHIRGLMLRPSYQSVAQQGVDFHLLSALTFEQQAILRDLFKLRDQYENAFVSIISDGVNDKTLSCEDPRLAARVILGALNSIAVWYKARTPETEAHKARLSNSITELLLSGLLANPEAI